MSAQPLGRFPSMLPPREPSALERLDHLANQVGFARSLVASAIYALDNECAELARRHLVAVLAKLETTP